MRASLQVGIVLAIGLYASATGLARPRRPETASFSTPIQALAITPRDSSTVYAGTDADNAPNDRGHGLFKSTNRGARWRASGLRAQNVLALAIDPRSTGTVYAGTQNGGVLKSSDGGGSWRNMRVTRGGTRSDAIAVNPRNRRVVYAATIGGVFKTTNGGESWRNVLARGYTYALAVDPQHPQVVYSGAYGFGVFKSTNGGASWRHIDVDVAGSNSIVCLAVDPERPSVVYAGSSVSDENDPSSGGVLKSADGGRTWRKIGLIGLEVSELAIDPEAAAIVYAATDDGVFKTEDAGATWLGDGFNGQRIGAIAIDPSRPQVVYVGTETAVYKTTDAGHSWVRSSRGIKNP